LKVFILECPSPLELIENISERNALEQVCKTMGHDVFSFLVKTRFEFANTIRYIASIDKIDRKKEEDEPICIHISAHGDKDGIQLGKDEVDWSKLAKCLTPLMEMDYNNNLYLVVSACGTDQQRVSAEITKLYKANDEIKPPKFVIVSNKDETSWEDAVLGWTILYRYIDKLELGKRKEVQSLFRRIKESEFANLRYFRWYEEDEAYKKYPSDDLTT
jgi:hypothetical protein